MLVQHANEVQIGNQVRKVVGLRKTGVNVGYE